jgi:hypothetical protein
MRSILHFLILEKLRVILSPTNDKTRKTAPYLFIFFLEKTTQNLISACKIFLPIVFFFTHHSKGFWL